MAKRVTFADDEINDFEDMMSQWKRAEKMLEDAKFHKNADELGLLSFACKSKAFMFQKACCRFLRDYPEYEPFRSQVFFAAIDLAIEFGRILEAQSLVKMGMTSLTEGQEIDKFLDYKIYLEGLENKEIEDLDGYS